MGNSKSAVQLEEILVNQNTTEGGVISVQLNQQQWQTGAANYFLLATLLLPTIGSLIILYYFYKKYNKLQREMNEYTLQRSASFFRLFDLWARGHLEVEV